MRLPKRGERGFTLIELLIVVAILGVLAAVVIPNVTRFVGAGEEEAAETELHNIQLAVTSMMLENGITEIPGAPGSAPAVVPLNDMESFPDIATTAAERNTNEGHPVGLLTQAGYLLYGHQIAYAADPDGIIDDIKLVNYVVVDTTTYFYTCETDGTVKQWPTNDPLPL